MTCIICEGITTPALVEVGVTVPDRERNGGVHRPVVGLCIGEPVIYIVYTYSVYVNACFYIMFICRNITENCRRMTGGVVAGLVGSRCGRASDRAGTRDPMLLGNV